VSWFLFFLHCLGSEEYRIFCLNEMILFSSTSRMVPTRTWARVARTFSAMISKEDERNNGYVAPIDGLLVQLLAGLALLHMAGHLSLAHLTPYFVPFFLS